MASTQALAPTADLALAPGMRIVFEALDPTTSLAVAGVTVERISIVGDVAGDKVLEVNMRNLMEVPPARTSSGGGAPARGSTGSGAARPPR